jgi:hypothetical protein
MPLLQLHVYKYLNFKTKTVKKLQARKIIKTENGRQRSHEIAMGCFAWYHSI